MSMTCSRNTSRNHEWIREKPGLIRERRQAFIDPMASRHQRFRFLENEQSGDSDACCAKHKDGHQHVDFQQIPHGCLLSPRIRRSPASATKAMPTMNKTARKM
jgi:hypothetical protein